MKRKLFALAFILANALAFSLLTVSERVLAYGYAFAKIGASAEDTLLYSAGAAAVGILFGPPGLLFTVTYTAACLL